MAGCAWAAAGLATSQERHFPYAPGGRTRLGEREAIRRASGRGLGGARAGDATILHSAGDAGSARECFGCPVVLCVGSSASIVRATALMPASIVPMQQDSAAATRATPADTKQTATDGGPCATASSSTTARPPGRSSPWKTRAPAPPPV